MFGLQPVVGDGIKVQKKTLNPKLMLGFRVFFSFLPSFTDNFIGKHSLVAITIVWFIACTSANLQGGIFSLFLFLIWHGLMKISVK
jgi:hypothetical protein